MGEERGGGSRGGDQGRRKEFFKGGGGGRFKCYSQKGYFCIDLSTNTLYRKCIKFAPKKGGRSTPPILPFLRPWSW